MAREPIQPSYPHPPAIPHPVWLEPRRRNPASDAVEASPAPAQPQLLQVETAGSSSRGLVRAAAQAVELDHRNEVDYRELPCRSVLSGVVSRRVPFQYAINPYRGCEFGCVYCYARYTHEFLEMPDWRDFERKIFVKQEAAAALRRDLQRLTFRGEWIAMGTATDPYQPAERRYLVTRSLLEVLAEASGLLLSLTTKSDLVARDVDLLAAIGRRNRVHVNLTITTPHHTLARKIEPRACRPDRRLLALRRLTEAGVSAGVFLMPLMPRINDRAEDVALLCEQAREAGATRLSTQVLFLHSCSRKRFWPFLQERFPELLSYYQTLYSDAGREALQAYVRQKSTEVAAIRRRYELDGSLEEWDDTPPPGDQLRLGLE